MILRGSLCVSRCLLCGVANGVMTASILASQGILEHACLLPGPRTLSRHPVPRPVAAISSPVNTYPIRFAHQPAAPRTRVIQGAAGRRGRGPRRRARIFGRGSAVIRALRRSRRRDCRRRRKLIAGGKGSGGGTECRRIGNQFAFAANGRWRRGGGGGGDGERSCGRGHSTRDCDPTSQLRVQRQGERLS